MFEIYFVIKKFTFNVRGVVTAKMIKSNKEIVNKDFRFCLYKRFVTKVRYSLIKKGLKDV